MLRALFGPKRFERLIGIRMWDSLGFTIAELEDRRKHFNAINPSNNEDYSNKWILAVWNIVTCYYDKDNFKKTAKNMLMYVDATKDTHSALLPWKDKPEYEEKWKNLLRKIEDRLKEFLEYCKTLKEMDKKNTWGECELAKYLIQKKMKMETAFKICKDIGAITIKDLVGLYKGKQVIYGHKNTDSAFPSLSFSEKLDLEEIYNEARAEDTTTAKLDAEAAAAQIDAAKLAAIKAAAAAKSPGESSEMTEGTYIGEKLDGRRHGKGFMIYKNKDTYDGEWSNDKMNGIGEFRKNVRSLTEYDWEFYGKFRDDCPVTGTVRKKTENQGLQIDVKKGVNIFEWDPFERKENISTLPTQTISTLLQQMQALHD